MLKGNKIVLRPLHDSDLDFLMRIENNKENWQYGSEKKQYSKQELTNYISNAKIDIKLANQFRFVVDLDGIAIGFIDLFDYTINSICIGVIITQDYRNKGFAKEALNLISDYAFKFLNLKKIHCSIQKDNLISNQLFTSCGFVFLREVKQLKYFIKLAKK